MKLFLKEHLPFFAIQLLQFSLFSLIMILGGFQDFSIILYGVLISFFLLICYLIYRYDQRKRVYQKLTSKPTTFENLLEKTDNVPFGYAFDQWNRNHYRMFMERLKEAEDAQENHLKFIDLWVHQMKTPLSVIELMAQELDEPESSNMREETERMKNGLQTVLYMARLRTIQEDFHIKPVSLGTFIHEVNKENKRFYIRNQVYPHLQMNEDDLVVETDEKWLYFMINQLIQNAVKYSAHKSKRINISIGKIEKQAVIEITDYGVGIPTHDQKRIFQPFFTGDNGRQFRESTGMGLYLTKEVADYLGHEIKVSSRVNEGTTFQIIFSETQTI